MRYDYGLSHSLEHLAVWVYLLALNADRLNLPLVWGSTVALLGLAALSLVLAGVWTNLTALHRLRHEVPEWVDPDLRPFVLRKCRDNALSHRWQHYLIKPFTPMVSSRRVAWRDIEAMVERIELRQRFDAVVGVLSGGAFITRLVADRNGIKAVHYARSRLWSKLSLAGNLVTSVRYYSGLQNGTESRFLDGEPDLSGQRVLVVDDSVCTGATLASVGALCRERGASEVRTLSLFCHPRHPSDYFYLHAKTPLVWPWGWEAD
jgi:hypoxanthine phosphoribosyltransferase